MKWLFTVLLLLCAGFFAYMQWGGSSTKDQDGSQPPFNTDRITLLPSAVPPAPVSAPESAVCMEWGDFSGEALKRASTALAALKLGDELSQRQVEHAFGYWVYLAPAKTKAETDKTITHLQELGVQDYFVIRDDEKWRNAISLGIFKTREAADNYLKNLTDKGVHSVQTGERTGKRTFTIFVLKNPSTTQVAKITLLQREYPGTQLQAAACGN